MNIFYHIEIEKACALCYNSAHRDIISLVASMATQIQEKIFEFERRQLSNVAWGARELVSSAVRQNYYNMPMRGWI